MVDGEDEMSVGGKMQGDQSLPVTSALRLSLAMEPLSPEVRQYPPHPAPGSRLIAASLLIYPSGSSLMEKKEGWDLQKEKKNLCPYITLQIFLPLTAAPSSILRELF